jgi:SAM-dependent methyltransferase
MQHYAGWPAGTRRQLNGWNRRWGAAFAPLYDRWWTNPLSAALGAELVRLAGPPGRLVVAMGSAWPAVAAALGAAGHRVIGVGRCPPNGPPVPGALWAVGTLDALPLRPAGADLVVAVNLLPVQRRPVAAAIRLAGLLAPGGRLICSWPNRFAGPMAMANAERQVGARWSTVSAHTAGRLTLDALDALTATDRGRSIRLAVRAAADAYGMETEWIDLPQAAQTLGVVGRQPVRAMLEA